jgi:hypothetical protein
VVNNDPRRRTVIRVGIVALVLAALGVGTAIGVAVGSKSSPPTNKSTANGTAHLSTSTSVPTTTTTTPLPAVLSCGPGSTPHVRPSKLIVGCAQGTVTVTGITWKEWAAVGGGQGTGTLNADMASVPAIVVVFDEVGGIFQDVSIIPSKDLPTTPNVPATGQQTTSTTAPATTPTTGGPSPVVASQPGSGWGGD